jgi:hypothetical protein
MFDESELLVKEKRGYYREAVKQHSPGLPRFGGYPGLEGLTVTTPTGVVHVPHLVGLSLQRSRSSVMFS